jgi:hypothetical protein
VSTGDGSGQALDIRYPSNVCGHMWRYNSCNNIISQKRPVAQSIPSAPTNPSDKLLSRGLRTARNKAITVYFQQQRQPQLRTGMVMTAMAPVAPGVRGIAGSLSSSRAGIMPLPPRSAASLAPHSSPVAAKRSVFAQAEHQQVSASNEVMAAFSTAFQLGVSPALANRLPPSNVAALCWRTSRSGEREGMCSCAELVADNAMSDSTFTYGLQRSDAMDRQPSGGAAAISLMASRSLSASLELDAPYLVSACWATGLKHASQPCLPQHSMAHAAVRLSCMTPLHHGLLHAQQEPLLRNFVLGASAGAILELLHVLFTVGAGQTTGVWYRHAGQC